jgi:hypothetical protein
MNPLCKIISGTGLLVALIGANVSAQSLASLSNLPLWFETGAAGKFTAHTSGSEFAITSAGTEFTLTKTSGEAAGCRLELVGADAAAKISGVQPLTGKVNYLHGNNPDQWQTSIATFGQVRVDQIYPGINLVYYGNQQKLEYDFDLAAGINPAVIGLRFTGAEKISVNPQGELVIRLHAGEVIQHAPVAYQIIDGKRQEVAASYQLVDAHTAAFSLGNYDRNEPLVIDPVLSYSSYFGGNNNDIGWAIAVSTNDGSIYVAGQTFSTKFKGSAPLATLGAFETKYNGAGDAFIARFDVDGTGTNLSLHYATYLGGSADDGALGLAVDNAGDAFVTGFTVSPNFPTAHALFNKIGGKLDLNTKQYLVDAFVTELNPAGSGLVYSTYLGGSSMDAAYGITLDDAGDAYVTGYSYSTNFPVTANAVQPRPACAPSLYINANAFVAEISPLGTNLNYSTYWGGTNFDEGHAITWNNGKLFVAGRTSSTNFPNTNAIAGFDRLNHGTKGYLTKPDAFITAFDTTIITNLMVEYSTFLGGSNYDEATGIAADANGSAYVCGATSSTDFPDTATNVPGLTSGLHFTNKSVVNLIFTNAIATNGFLTRIDWNGTNPVIGYSALFGGKAVDIANGVAVDPSGNAYVVGFTRSLDFPTNNTYGSFAKKSSSFFNTNNADVFVIAFSANCTNLLYSGCLGGKGDDVGNAIAVDSAGNAYITGRTTSANFPTTTNALQSFRNGTNDMFIAIISPTISPLPGLVLAPENISAGHSKVAGSSPAQGIGLKWQMFPANVKYGLESSADLTGSNWHAIAASPTYTNGWYHVTLPTTNGVQFFRLHRP